MLTGLVFFVLGGLMAMAIRWQLAWPWSKMPVIGNVLFPHTGEAITPEFYTMLFTMHGTIMIFLRDHPTAHRSVRELPDPADDRCSRHGVPAAEHAGLLVRCVPAMVCMLLAFGAEGGGPASGWTAYPPLATIETAAPGSYERSELLAPRR